MYFRRVIFIEYGKWINGLRLKRLIPKQVTDEVTFEKIAKNSSSIKMGIKRYPYKRKDHNFKNVVINRIKHHRTTRTNKIRIENMLELE